jgi:hypothetical protein
MTTFEHATVVSYAATRAQRSAAGKALRAKAPRTSHHERVSSSQQATSWRAVPHAI